LFTALTFCGNHLPRNLLRARIFTEFENKILEIWSTPRRVIGKAEQPEGKSETRFEEAPENDISVDINQPT